MGFTYSYEHDPKMAYENGLDEELVRLQYEGEKEQESIKEALGSIRNKIRMQEKMVKDLTWFKIYILKA